MMQTEQRWCERKPVALDVTLYDTRLGIVRGKTRNVSLEGMYVETGSVALPKNSLLEVAFHVGDQEGGQLHRVQALVAHSSESGAGLMLVHSQVGAINALSSVINEPTQPALAS